MNTNHMNRLKRLRQRGQGMTEYIILVGVIAILLIIVTYRYGGEVSAMFGSAQSQLESTNTAVDGAGADGVKTNK